MLYSTGTFGTSLPTSSYIGEPLPVWPTASFDSECSSWKWLTSPISSGGGLSSMASACNSLLPNPGESVLVSVSSVRVGPFCGCFVGCRRLRIMKKATAAAMTATTPITMPTIAPVLNEFCALLAEEPSSSDGSGSFSSSSSPSSEFEVDLEPLGRMVTTFSSAPSSQVHCDTLKTCRS